LILQEAAKMIYDVRSDYYQGFLSTKQGALGKDKKPKAAGGAPSASDGDAMETE
jgi:hypothetical protein